MDDLPRTLYHYTDGAGLLGILRSKTLWCSHVYYLNDSLEHRIGRTLFREVLADVVTSRGGSSLRREVARTALMYLDRTTYEQAPAHAAGNYFVGSFTTEHDDLAQWRGYSSPGSRFCVGFNFSQLQALESVSQLCLGKITYDNSATQQAMRNAFLGKADDLISLRQADGYHPDDPLSWNPTDYYDLIWRVANIDSPLVKHRSFEAESEWRLFSSAENFHGLFNTSSIFFRVGRSFLIPYISADLSPLEHPISSIKAGPTPHPGDAKASLQMLVRQWCRHEDNIGSQLLAPALDISVSDIPYRDW